MKTIRWGIIGCGAVCEVKSGPGFQRAAHSALVAVMRRDGAKAKDFAARHGVPRWYDSADALVSDPEVDAVYVATPPGSHAEHALRAARAGKPVYVEKPMALDHAECLRVIEACRAAGTPLFTAYYRRSLPRFAAYKRVIDAGEIGALRSVNVTLSVSPSGDYLDAENPPWRMVPELAGGGWFLDMASHTVDLLDFLLGPVAEARGIAANLSGTHRVEDAVAAAFRFESGALGAGMWTFSAATRDDRVEVIGSKGRLLFSTFGDEPARVITATAGAREISVANPAHIQQPHIQSIVDELNGAGRCPSTGESAARATKVMDEILRDYRAQAR